MSWEAKLIRPIAPPKGKPIITLSDARAYVLTLSQAEQNAPHVQSGVSVLMLAADGEVDEFTAQSAVAHIVHGRPKTLNRGKRDRPWRERKAKT